jgi:hypothetical protein
MPERMIDAGQAIKAHGSEPTLRRAIIVGAAFAALSFTVPLLRPLGGRFSLVLPRLGLWIACPHYRPSLLGRPEIRPERLLVHRATL